MIDVTRLLPKLVRANPELAAKLVWAQAVGEGLRRNTVPMRLDGQTLIVAVPDALWKKQLESMAGELLFRIKNLLGGGVNELAFHIAPAEISRAQPLKPEEPRKETRPNALPTELLFAAGSITDEDLRERFLRAAD